VFLILSRAPPSSPLFPYTTLFRSRCQRAEIADRQPRCADRAVRGGTRQGSLSAAADHRSGGHAIRPTAEILLHAAQGAVRRSARSEEHTSELQSPYDLVCRLLLEK